MGDFDKIDAHTILFPGMSDDHLGSVEWFDSTMVQVVHFVQHHLGQSWIWSDDMRLASEDGETLCLSFTHEDLDIDVTFQNPSLDEQGNELDLPYGFTLSVNDGEQTIQRRAKDPVHMMVLLADSIMSVDFRLLATLKNQVAEKIRECLAIKPTFELFIQGAEEEFVVSDDPKESNEYERPVIDALLALTPYHDYITSIEKNTTTQGMIVHFSLGDIPGQMKIDSHEGSIRFSASVSEGFADEKAWITYSGGIEMDQVWGEGYECIQQITQRFGVFFSYLENAKPL